MCRKRKPSPAQVAVQDAADDGEEAGEGAMGEEDDGEEAGKGATGEEDDGEDGGGDRAGDP